MSMQLAERRAARLLDEVSGAEDEVRYTSPVSTEAHRIIEAALNLPDSERAFVAAVLTDSIGDGSTQEEVEAAWLEEVKRRRDDLDAGRTHTVPWEDVRQKLHAKIKRARERRPPLRPHAIGVDGCGGGRHR